MSFPARVTYQFGPYTLDPDSATLARNGQRVRLQEQPYRLLAVLVEQAGTIVDREMIQRILWPENTFVDFDKSVGVAMQKVRAALRDEAANPRFIETVRGRGYRFVAPVTVLKAEPMVVEMEASPLRPPTLPVPRTIPLGKLAVWMSAALLAVVILSGSYYYASSRAGTRPKPVVMPETTRPRARRSLAVLGFQNLSGQAADDWLSAALSEMLCTELSTGNQLRLVSSEDVSRTKHDLGIQSNGTLGIQTLAHFRQMSGADFLVMGSFTELANSPKRRLRLDVRLQDTRSGETVLENSFERPNDELFELAYQAGAQLRQELGLPQSLAVAQILPDLPTNPTAIRWYVEGRAKLWAFDFTEARDLLRRAAAADPSYPMVHAGLSEVWGHLGYDANARAEAKRALELSQRLPREEALLIEGRYWASLNNLAQAEGVYRELFRIFPDQLGYGLQLAEVELRTKPSQALNTLAALRTLPAPLRDDPRIDMLESSALLTQDVVKSRAAIMRAIQKANAQGSKLILARAYGILCQQDQTNIKSSQSLSECATARDSYVQAGDLGNAARTLNDMAGIYYLRGEVQKAEEMWHEASARFRKSGDAQALAATLNNIGDAELTQGNLSQAQTLLEQAISQYTQIGDQDGTALALTDLALVSRQQGDSAGARALYQKATAVAVQIEDKLAQAFGLMGSGDVLLDERQYAAAEKLYQQALQIRTAVGDTTGATQCRLALARVSLEKGDAAAAEQAVRVTEASLAGEQKANEDGLSAGILLADSLLKQGKVDEAGKEFESVRLVAQKSQNRYLRMQARLTGVRVNLQQRHTDRAKDMLTELLAEARKFGFRVLERDIDDVARRVVTGRR